MLNVRKQLTYEILKSFDLTEKQKNEHINSMIKAIQSNNKEETTNFLYQVESDPYLWLFEEERKHLLALSRRIITSMDVAESIYIDTKITFEERQRYWSLAIGYCQALLSEIQYLSEVLPKDKNRLTNLVLDIDKVIQLLKSLKSYDKKFVKDIE